MSIAIRGFGSEIVRSLIRLLPADEEVINLGREGHAAKADRYLFCGGFLAGKNILHLTDDEFLETMDANFRSVIMACENIFADKPAARICVIGSESGLSGSYDMAYAGAKAAMHLYIETKRLSAEQQLVGIAPSIIEDCGMTMRRPDQVRLEERSRLHPKGRFLKAAEVAALTHFLLYVDRGYITNTVIRMHGGERK